MILRNKFMLFKKSKIQFLDIKILIYQITKFFISKSKSEFSIWTCSNTLDLMKKPNHYIEYIHQRWSDVFENNNNNVIINYAY